jgi:hypothetical protein
MMFSVIAVTLASVAAMTAIKLQSLEAGRALIVWRGNLSQALVAEGET